MSNCMLIPTYWYTPDLPSWQIFDHPISIDEVGTLARTLDNLEKNAYSDPVVLFPAPLDIRIIEKVRSIAAGRSIDIRIFDHNDLNDIHLKLQQAGFPPDLLHTMDLNSYGGVRNMGLLYAVVHGFENVVMIDDDECIDSGYREIAIRSMGTLLNGQEILGKTGCVVDSEGKKFYDGQSSLGLETWPKDALFNENVRMELEAQGQISHCTVAFGGNMVLNRKLFLQVPFDPFGTRGEDDDYVLNARYCGFPFFFDKNLLLLHLPPKRNGSYWTRQRQDIQRFKYIREKVRIFGFDPKILGSFLEYFTQDDLESKAVSSSIQAAITFIDTDRSECLGFLQNAISAEIPSRQVFKERAEAFLRFLHAWRQCVPKISG
jgi:hypothetical protein